MESMESFIEWDIIEIIAADNDKNIVKAVNGIVNMMMVIR